MNAGGYLRALEYRDRHPPQGGNEQPDIAGLGALRGRPVPSYGNFRLQSDSGRSLTVRRLPPGDRHMFCNGAIRRHVSREVQVSSKPSDHGDRMLRRLVVPLAVVMALVGAVLAGVLGVVSGAAAAGTLQATYSYDNCPDSWGCGANHCEPRRTGA